MFFMSAVDEEDKLDRKKAEYKVEVKKFCRNCGKSTAHKEVKS